MISSDISSLDEALRSLARDLAKGPSLISAHSGIPFAILRYAPQDEFLFRRQIRLFANQLKEKNNYSVLFISLSRIVSEAIANSRNDLYATEKYYGFVDAEHKEIESLIKGPDRDGSYPPKALFKAIMDTVLAVQLPPDLVFLVRAGGLAPHAYRASALLNDLQQAGFSTPTILCYPGSAVAGTDLRFYDLPAEEGLGTYNYRVKIYGTC